MALIPAIVFGLITFWLHRRLVRATALPRPWSIVADAALMAYVHETVQRYLALPWASVLHSKQLTNLAFEQPYEAARDLYFATQAIAMLSDDHYEALEAYRREQEQKHRSQEPTEDPSETL